MTCTDRCILVKFLVNKRDFDKQIQDVLFIISIRSNRQLAYKAV